jgi:hypothetical protein
MSIDPNLNLVKYSLGGPDSGILLYLKTFVTNEGVLKDDILHGINT